MRELTMEALVENLYKVTGFVTEQLKDCDCPEDKILQVVLAVEEVFVNIASYAYNPVVGAATVRTEIKDDPAAVVLTFLDHGTPYNPLEKEDPDVTLSAEEREVGGLGIFFAKNVMDETGYEYKDGQNILTLIKYL